MQVDEEVKYQTVLILNEKKLANKQRTVLVSNGRPSYSSSSLAVSVVVLVLFCSTFSSILGAGRSQSEAASASASAAEAAASNLRTSDDQLDINLEDKIYEWAFGEARQRRSTQGSQSDLQLKQSNASTFRHKVVDDNLLNVIKKPKPLKLRVSAIYVAESEFPLSRQLFNLTIIYAVSEMNKRLERHGVELVPSVKYAGTCARQYAAAISAEEYHLYKARLFIVSGCDEAIRQVSRMAAVWSTPVLTPAGFSADLDNKRVYKTLIRVSFSVQGIVDFLIKIFKSFKWRNINLIVDESHPNSVILRSSIVKHFKRYSPDYLDTSLGADSEHQQSTNNSTKSNDHFVDSDGTNFYISLNELKLDLTSLLSQQSSFTSNQSISHSAFIGKPTDSGRDDVKVKTNTEKRQHEADIWPNEASDYAVRDSLHQSALWSHVNILLVPQEYLRRFMLTAYDMDMANGQYSFISLPLVQVSNSNENQQQDNNKSEQKARTQVASNDDEFLWRAAGSPRNSHARQAFESVMAIYLRAPTTKMYVNFVGKIIELAAARQQYGVSKTTTSASLDINSYLASFYDCIDIFSTALDESLTELRQFKQFKQPALLSQSKENKTSKAITASAKLGNAICYKLRKRKFDNLLTGSSVSFDENGDRETDYTLDDMSSMTGKLRPVISYKGETGAIERLARIQWASSSSQSKAGADIGPSSDSPDCTVAGTCVNKTRRLIISILLVLMPIALAVSSGLYAVYRRISMESALVDYWWRIKFNEIEILESITKSCADESSAVGGADSASVGGTSAVYRRTKRADKSMVGSNQLEAEDDPDNAKSGCRSGLSRANQSSMTRGTSGVSSAHLDVCYGNNILGLYKFNKVSLKPMTRLAQPRSLMVELRTLKTVITHPNICRFNGIVVEEPNIAVVTEYCPKASLRQFFQNDTMILDWTFKFSMLNDIMAGLTFLHGSPVGFHGRLKATNCLISSRFVVKLSDYGVPSLYKQLDAELDEESLDKKRICLAPEHLKKNKTGASGTSKKGDVYSFGFLLYEILTGEIPFFDAKAGEYIKPVNELISELQNGCLGEKAGYELAEKLTNWVSNSNNLADDSCGDAPDLAYVSNLMLDCFSIDPSKRPTMVSLAASLKRITGGANPKKLLENLTGRMEQYNNNLEAIVDSKLALFVQEKAKTDELLYQFVPKSVAQILKDGNRVEPEAFECITVFNSDIVAFTSLSSESTPMQVVDFLCDLYTCFDEVLDCYDIFKVETIGDAYIVASGLPERNGDQHAIQIASAALELNARLGSFKLKHKPGKKVEMRIGIHSGPCVAGVVGGVPKYCLFGDTILVGKFMESSGLPRKIHVTEQSKLLLERVPAFTLTPRSPRVTREGLPYPTYWLDATDAITQAASGAAGSVGAAILASASTGASANFVITATPQTVVTCVDDTSKP